MRLLSVANLRWVVRHRAWTPYYLKRYWRFAWFKLRHPQVVTEGFVFLGKHLEIVARRGHGRIILGKWVHLGDETRLRAHEGTLRIGDKVVFARDVTVNCYLDVEIGASTLIADWTYICDFDHKTEDLDLPIKDQGLVKSPVRIGPDCWLATKVTVTRGTEIGRGAVVGANSVARGNIPPYTVAAGVPAVVVADRTTRYEATADRRKYLAGLTEANNRTTTQLHTGTLPTPTAPTAPTASAATTASAGPTTPAAPTSPAAPTASAASTATAVPAAPTASAASTAFAGPTAPAAPAAPTTPAAPAAPTTPAAPAAPAAPTASAASTASAGRTAPAASAAPTAPTAPAASAAPTAPAARAAPTAPAARAAPAQPATPTTSAEPAAAVGSAASSSADDAHLSFDQSRAISTFRLADQARPITEPASPSGNVSSTARSVVPDSAVSDEVEAGGEKESSEGFSSYSPVRHYGPHVRSDAHDRMTVGEEK